MYTISIEEQIMMGFFDDSLLKTSHYTTGSKFKVYVAPSGPADLITLTSDLHLFETSRTLIRLFLSKFDAKLRNWPVRKIIRVAVYFAWWWCSETNFGSSCSSCTEKS